MLRLVLQSWSVSKMVTSGNTAYSTYSRGSFVYVKLFHETSAVRKSLGLEPNFNIYLLSFSFYDP
jgi:hypothetical protein